MVKKSKTTIILFIVSIFLFRCANQLPPSGGEIDTIPPQIIKVFPQNGTTNFHDNYFEITFSEYVDKRSVRDAIFISPPLQHSLEYDWSGRTLTVYFKDTLKQNTTYTITIGAEVEDVNNRNKLIEPYSFAFSTGEKIDSGKISGKIYDKNPTGAMVYAYKKVGTDIEPSNAVFRHARQKPDYISQVGKNGKYNLVGLGMGEYNVFAFKDKFRDFLYQKNEDEYGVQNKKIILTKESSEINNVDFFLTKEDTIPPKVSNVLMKDRNHILVEFNKGIDSTIISADNFKIFDSTTQRYIQPKYFFKGDAKSNQFYLGIKDTLRMGNEVFLISENIVDLKGNKSQKEKTSFSVNTGADTIPPKIIKVESSYPSNSVDYDFPVLTLKFNDAIEPVGRQARPVCREASLDSLTKSIRVVDFKKNIYPLEIRKIDDAAFDILIKSKLKQKAEYTLEINLKDLVDIAENKVDSLYKYKFITASELDFSGVSGSVYFEKDSNNTFVVLENTENSKNYYKQKVNKENKFNFQKVIPGKYLIWSFIDKNNDGVYSYGKVKPFEFAEEFKFYPDTLNLRARWPVEGVNIR